MIDERLMNFAIIMQDLDNPEYEGIKRTQLLHPATRSWITGEYPKNPTPWLDEQWHAAWHVIQHKALEFHTEFVHAAEKGEIDLENTEDVEFINETACVLWSLWFELEFHSDSVKGKGILQEAK